MWTIWNSNINIYIFGIYKILIFSLYNLVINIANRKYFIKGIFLVKINLNVFQYQIYFLFLSLEIFLIF